MSNPPSGTGEKINVSSRYMYYVENPFKRQEWTYDKYGAACLISMEQYLDEIEKPNNRFKRTAFEEIAPKILIGASILLICAIVWLSQ